MRDKRKTSNPLALAVMGQLFERPMHPYEIAATMKERRQHESVKLNYGSLYTVVDALARDGFIEPRETVREGRRPERTVYGITAAGRAEFLGWLRDLLRQPVKEYMQFEAGLSFLSAVPPGEAAALLEERARLLGVEIEEKKATLSGVVESGVPRLFLIEAEHEIVSREAELGWVEGLAREVAAGTLDGTEEWMALHTDEG